MPTLGLQSLLDALDRLPADAVETGPVEELLQRARLSGSDLQPFVDPRPDRYSRRLIRRTPLFDVIALTWLPGQRTPIHNHAGNLGWVRLMQGVIVEDRYELRSSGGLVRLAHEADADGRGVELAATGRTVVREPGAVATVDRQRAIHQMGVPRELGGQGPTVTLHVYSKPHDVCLAFDPVARTCGRREMRFDEGPVGG